MMFSFSRNSDSDFNVESWTMKFVLLRPEWRAGKPWIWTHRTIRVVPLAISAAVSEPHPISSLNTIVITKSEDIWYDSDNFFIWWRYNVSRWLRTSFDGLTTTKTSMSFFCSRSHKKPIIYFRLYLDFRNTICNECLQVNGEFNQWRTIVESVQ